MTAKYRLKVKAQISNHLNFIPLIALSKTYLFASSPKYVKFVTCEIPEVFKSLLNQVKHICLTITTTCYYLSYISQ